MKPAGEMILLSAAATLLLLANSVYCLGTVYSVKYIYLAAVKLSTGCVKLIDVAKLACIQYIAV